MKIVGGWEFERRRVTA